MVTDAVSATGRPEREHRSAQREETAVGLYGNNDALLASVGSTVRKGEAIAQAGASGASPEPGLYCEVRHQGAAVDPAPWIGH
jgi:septal ring factor EnvC (AmiA/AmiB activator)